MSKDVDKKVIELQVTKQDVILPNEGQHLYYDASSGYHFMPNRDAIMRGVEKVNSIYANGVTITIQRFLDYCDENRELIEKYLK